MSKSAQRQFLVKVEGIEGYFMTKTGGNVSAGTSKVYDGGAQTPDVIAAPAEAENVTMSRGYDPDRDNSTIQQLRQMVGRWTTTVSVTPTDLDLAATADPTVYPDALLVGLNEPEVNAGSGDPATFELEFAIGQFR